LWLDWKRSSLLGLILRRFPDDQELRIASLSTAESGCDPGNPAALSLRWSLIASKVAAMEMVEQGKLGFHEADLAGVRDTTG